MSSIGDIPDLIRKLTRSVREFGKEIDNMLSPAMLEIVGDIKSDRKAAGERLKGEGPLIPTRAAPMSFLERAGKAFAVVKPQVITGLQTGFKSMAGALNPLKILKGIGGGIWKGMKKAFDSIKNAFSIDTLLSMIEFNRILEAVQFIMAPFNALLGVFVAQLQAGLAPVISKLFEVMLDPRMIELTGALAELIIAFLVPALEIFIGVMNFLLDSGVIGAITEGIKFLANAMTFAWDLLKVVWDGIVNFFTDLPTILMDGLAAIGQFFVDLGISIVQALILGTSAVVDFFVNLGNSIVQALITFGATLVEVFVNLWDGFVAIFTDGWNGIVSFLTLLWDGVLIGVKAFVNFFIDIINGVITGINALDFADAFADIPTIPRLNTGGVVRQGGIAIVDPLDTVFSPEMTEAIINNTRNGGGTTNNTKQVEININQPMVLDHDSIRLVAREVSKELTFL